MMGSPEYQGQEIHLEGDAYRDSQYNNFNWTEVGTSETKPMSVFWEALLIPLVPV